MERLRSPEARMHGSRPGLAVLACDQQREFFVMPVQQFLELEEDVRA